MEPLENHKIIEALLFASPDPLTQTKINNVFNHNAPNLKQIVNELNETYKKEDHAFEIRNIAGGYQLLSKAEYEYFIKLMIKKSDNISLSSAALDTLAIIAYKQPISRFEIESIRGVDSSGVLKTIITKNLVSIKGRDTGPGRPLLYQTTKVFLEYFGLNRISDLPKLKEIDELIEADGSLGQQIDAFKNYGPKTDD